MGKLNREKLNEAIFAIGATIGVMIIICTVTYLVAVHPLVLACLIALSCISWFICWLYDVTLEDVLALWNKLRRKTK